MHVPHYTELSVKAVWSTFKQNATIMKHMPDYNEDELPEREFLYGIVTTIYPDEMKDLISNTRTRRATKNITEKDQKVEVS